MSTTAVLLYKQSNNHSQDNDCMWSEKKDFGSNSTSSLFSKLTMKSYHQRCTRIAMLILQAGGPKGLTQTKKENGSKGENITKEKKKAC